MGTRLKQASFESRGTTEFDWASPSGGGFGVVSTCARSGSYSLRSGIQNTLWAEWRSFTASQVQLGFGFIPREVQSGSPYAISFLNGGTLVAALQINNGLQLVLNVGGSTKDSSSAVLQEYVWQHIGIDLKIDATGWFATYVDGRLEAYWSGNTAAAAGSVDNVQVGRGVGISYFKHYAYFDDVYLDDTSSCASASPPPDRRFVPIHVEAAGASAQWDVTGAGSNFQAVDDWLTGVHDSGATYVGTSANNQVDFYDVEDLAASAISASNTIIAYVVHGTALKTNAVASTCVNMAIRSNGSTAYSSDLELGSDWGPVFDRFTTDPNTGAAWSGSAAINAVQVGVRSRGL